MFIKNIKSNIKYILYVCIIIIIIIIIFIITKNLFFKTNKNNEEFTDTSTTTQQTTSYTLPNSFTLKAGSFIGIDINDINDPNYGRVFMKQSLLPNDNCYYLQNTIFNKIGFINQLNDGSFIYTKKRIIFTDSELINQSSDGTFFNKNADDSLLLNKSLNLSNTPDIETKMCQLPLNFIDINNQINNNIIETNGQLITLTNTQKNIMTTMFLDRLYSHSLETESLDIIEESKKAFPYHNWILKDNTKYIFNNIIQLKDGTYIGVDFRKNTNHVLYNPSIFKSNVLGPMENWEIIEINIDTYPINIIELIDNTYICYDINGNINTTNNLFSTDKWIKTEISYTMPNFNNLIQLKKDTLVNITNDKVNLKIFKNRIDPPLPNNISDSFDDIPYLSDNISSSSDDIQYKYDNPLYKYNNPGSSSDNILTPPQNINILHYNYFKISTYAIQGDYLLFQIDNTGCIKTIIIIDDKGRKIAQPKLPLRSLISNMFKPMLNSNSNLLMIKLNVKNNDPLKISSIYIEFDGITNFNEYDINLHLFNNDSNSNNIKTRYDNYVKNNTPLDLMNMQPLITWKIKKSDELLDNQKSYRIFNITDPNATNTTTNNTQSTPNATNISPFRNIKEQFASGSINVLPNSINVPINQLLPSTILPLDVLIADTQAQTTQAQTTQAQTTQAQTTQAQTTQAQTTQAQTTTSLTPTGTGTTNPQTTTSSTPTGTGTTTTFKSGITTTKPLGTIPLTTYGYKISNRIPNGLDINPQTNVYQKNFDGTSNIYTPNIYHSMEAFSPLNLYDDKYSPY
jgi:hypothetical protein